MQLLYLWIQKSRLFCNRGFNFSGEYDFKFNSEEKSLGCTYNDKYPSKLYNSENVELISYIVGENGNGKTTLLEMLMEILPYDCGICCSSDLKCIYALKDGTGNDIYVYTTLDGIKIEPGKGVKIKNCEGSTITKLKVSRGFFVCEEMNKTSVIFHSNVFNRDRYNFQNRFSGVEDISFNGFLKSAYEYRTTDIGQGVKSELRYFLDRDMMCQISFISEGSKCLPRRGIPFSLPQGLKVRFEGEGNILGHIYKYAEMEDETAKETDLDLLRKKAAQKCNCIVGKYDSLFNDSDFWLQDKINKGILMSRIRVVFPETVGMGTHKEFEKLISSLDEFLEGDYRYGNSLEYIERFIDIVNGESEKLKDAVRVLYKLVQDSNLFKANKAEDGFYIVNKKEFMKEFYDSYRKTAFGSDYVSFQWEGLSSGEYNMLSMYSRIFSLNDDLQMADSLIFLIDEADMSYHPRWQQDYVYNLVHFLNQSYKGKHIQLIIATHSPIMLSDALKENVIFLFEENEDKKKSENTFGANIYDLYRKGMFLNESGLGVIGKYASDKIEKVIQMIKSWEENLKADDLKNMEEVDKFIDHIGESVINRILRKKFDRIVNKSKEITKQDKLSPLIEELKKLNSEELNRVFREVEKK